MIVKLIFEFLSQFSGGDDIANDLAFRIGVDGLGGGQAQALTNSPLLGGQIGN